MELSRSHSPPNNQGGGTRGSVGLGETKRPKDSQGRERGLADTHGGEEGRVGTSERTDGEAGKEY